MVESLLQATRAFALLRFCAAPSPVGSVWGRSSSRRLSNVFGAECVEDLSPVRRVFVRRWRGDGRDQRLAHFALQFAADALAAEEKRFARLWR
eukprot:1323861-Pleurochrysis_carterae.AAC.6